MFKRLIIALTSLIAFGLSSNAYADINSDLQNICTIVKNNDKSELRKKMKNIKKDYKLKLGDYYSGVSCGGQSMIRYAMQNSADDVGKYLIKKMKKGDLKAAEKDGQTVKQWAEANGHIGGVIGSALVARIG